MHKTAWAFCGLHDVMQLSIFVPCDNATHSGSGDSHLPPDPLDLMLVLSEYYSRLMCLHDEGCEGLHVVYMLHYINIS